jgi:zona occludens toxin (predicted ATPase)
VLTHKLYDNKYKIRIISLKKKQEKNDYLKAKGKKKEKDEFSMYQMLK